MKTFLFLLLLAGAALATHQHDNASINATANFTLDCLALNTSGNLTSFSCNLTQLSRAVEPQLNASTSLAIAALENYATKEKLSHDLEGILNDVNYRIALVNSSVTLEIVNLIAAFKDAAANESFVKLTEKFNSSISTYDTTVNERLEGLKIRLVTKEEMQEKEGNLTILMNANGQFLVQKIDGDNLISRMIAVIAAIAVFAFVWRMPRKAEQQLGILSTGGDRISIEDMINPEYQKAVREAYNLKVAVNKMKLPAAVRKKAFERIDEGIINKENVHVILEGIKAEQQEKEESVKTLKKKLGEERHDKERTKRDKA